MPDPPIPLYFAGASLLEIFPIVPITANISIGVGALSYAGHFNLTVVADREFCHTSRYSSLPCTFPRWAQALG